MDAPANVWPFNHQSGPSSPDTLTNPTRIGCAPTFQIGCDQGVCRPWTLHRGFCPWRRAKGPPSPYAILANRAPIGCRHLDADGSLHERFSYGLRGTGNVGQSVHGVTNQSDGPIDVVLRGIKPEAETDRSISFITAQTYCSQHIRGLRNAGRTCRTC